jgi:hypothetical protein
MVKYDIKRPVRITLEPHGNQECLVAIRTGLREQLTRKFNRTGSMVFQNKFKDQEEAIGVLRKLCSENSHGTLVSTVEDGAPDWIIENGRLRNSKANYFSIGLYSTDSGNPLLLMEQKETALVMLLVSRIEGKEAVLLSLRTEPGLIGLTNFSTTIQSTPSNYLRKHGGKGTPFIEIAVDPKAYGTVLYEGEHHDWGDYYHDKTKRFLIVKLASPVEAPAGFCWVDLETAQALLLEDNLVTNDLRVSIPLLDARSSHHSLLRHGAVPLSESRPPLQSLEYSPSLVDSRGTTVSFFQTQTETREVRAWVQPLLVPRNVMEISLPFAQTKSGRIFAVEKKTQPGLRGHQLWFPANKKSGCIARAVSTSAEGGRFWRFPIDIKLVEVESPRDRAGIMGAGETWMSKEELATLVAQSLQTSLELRMAWSLVCSDSFDAS